MGLVVRCLLRVLCPRFLVGRTFSIDVRFYGQGVRLFGAGVVCRVSVLFWASRVVFVFRGWSF